MVMPQRQKELVIGRAMTGDLTVHDQIGCELVADALRAGAETRVRVMGTSMLPALWPGDVLVIRGRTAPPSPHDIVLFLRYGRLFAHRVVRTTESELVTRGDALTDRDPPLRASEVLGVVVGIIRDGPRLIPVRAPSAAQRMAALAIRRSEAVYRLVLKWHNARVRLGQRHHRRPWQVE